MTPCNYALPPLIQSFESDMHGDCIVYPYIPYVVHGIIRIFLSIYVMCTAGKKREEKSRIKRLYYLGSLVLQWRISWCTYILINSIPASWKWEQQGRIALSIQRDAVYIYFLSELVGTNLRAIGRYIYEKKHSYTPMEINMSGLKESAGRKYRRFIFVQN